MTDSKQEKAGQKALRAAIRFRQQGQLKPAERAYRRALEADPADMAALQGLSVLLIDQGRSKEAVPLLHLLLDQRPDSVDGNNDMGVALMALGHFREALPYYDKVLASAPDHALVHNNIGNALHKLGHDAEAVDWFAKAVALKPDYARVHANLGVVLRENGRIDDAVMAFEKAIALEPGNAGFYRLLAEARPFSADDRHIGPLAALAERRRQMPVPDQIELCFACAKLYDDIGEHDRAFGYLLEGNALKRRQIAYDEAETLNFLRQIEAVFTSELSRTRLASGNPAAAPVFIFGMPRSGSTLIEQILAAHPAVVSIGEDAALSRLIDAATAEDGTTFPDVARDLSGSFWARIADGYLAHITGIAPTARRVVNKMPGNFVLAGLIHLIFPNARLIHTMRDPADTCLSCFAQLFDQGYPYSFDLAELGRFYRTYERLMAHWRSVLPEGVMLEVQYESFVADSEQQTRRILAHCGLDWDESCLTFWRSSRPVRTASASQVRRPIHQGAVGRSRRHGVGLARLLQALDSGS